MDARVPSNCIETGSSHVVEPGLKHVLVDPHMRDGEYFVFSPPKAGFLQALSPPLLWLDPKRDFRAKLWRWRHLAVHDWSLRQLARAVVTQISVTFGHSADGKPLSYEQGDVSSAARTGVFQKLGLQSFFVDWLPVAPVGVPAIGERKKSC